MNKTVCRKRGRTVCMILFCFLVFFCTDRVKGAELIEKEITVSAELGYEGYGKFGRMTPAHIEVSSSVNFEGTVKLIVPAEGGEKNYAYEYPIKVEAGKSAAVRADFPLTAGYTLFYIEVIGQDGEVYATCEEHITTPSSQLTELYVGVVSAEREAYLAFQAQKIGADSISSFPYVTTRSFALASEDITTYSEGMESLDIIVLDGEAYLGLSENQKAALESWANEGGILLREIKEKTSWLEESDRVTAPVETRPIFWTQQEETGKGTKCYIWIDSDQTNMVEYMGENAELVPAVLGLVCKMELVNWIVEKDHYYEGLQQYEWATAMLRSSVVKRMPHIILYGFVLTLYLVLAGPVLYLYLKKHDKTGLTTKGISSLAVGFSLLIFLVSFSTRYTKPFVQYASIYSVQNNQMKEETYLALRAPRHKTYSMGVDAGYQIKPINSGNYYYYENVNTDTSRKDSQAGIFYHTEYTAVTIEKSAPFSAEYFAIERYKPLEEKWGFVSDITCLTDEIAGEVTNQSGHKLTDVLLLTREGAILLGDMEAEETVRVENREMVNYILDSYTKAVYRMLGMGYSADQIQTATQTMLEKARTLEYYLKSTEVEQGSGILIGFSDSTDAQWQIGTEYPVSGVTMITEKVDFDRRETIEEERFILLEEAVEIGSSMEEVRMERTDTIVSPDGPGGIIRTEADQGIIIPSKNMTPGEEGTSMIEGDATQEEERRGFIYEYTVESIEDLKEITFIDQMPQLKYEGEILLLNRRTMETYRVSGLEESIAMEEIRSCFYTKNGVPNISVFYIPSDMENVNYPVMKLKNQVVLEYTFLSEEDISVNNEGEYDARQNSTTNTSIQLKYYIRNRDQVESIIFVAPKVEADSMMYQAFNGNLYFLHVDNAEFTRMESQENQFTAEALEAYIDVDMKGSYLTVQYISGTLNYGTEKQICLPQICVVRKK